MMMLMKKKLLSCFVLPAVVLCSFASPGFGKDKSFLTVQGNVDNGYQVARAGKMPRGTAPVVDAVMAVPVVRGNLDSSSMLNSRTAFLKPGGAFSLSLEKDRDWLLVLINSPAAGADRYAGQIAFQTADPGKTLLLLPVSSAVVSRLNIGKIVSSSGVALAQRAIDPSDFSMTTQQLAALARNDDRFSNVRNLIVNYDPVTGITYALRPDFHWPGIYPAIFGAFGRPEQYAYKSYNFQLDSNSIELSMSQVCGPSRTAVELFPPAGAQLQSRNLPMPADDAVPAAYRTYTATAPISNDNAFCSIAADGATEAAETANGDFFASDRYGTIAYTFGTDLLTDPVPVGLWTYRVNGADRAQFDFSSPVFAPNIEYGRVNGIAPVIRVNADTAGRITSVDVQWYVVNTTTIPATYDRITDLTMLQHLIGSADIFFDNSSGGPRRYESVHFDPAVQTNVAPANAWYYGFAGTAGEQAESIGVFYSSAGLGYFFTFERFLFPSGTPTLLLPVPARYTAYPGPAPLVSPDPCIRPENLSFVTRSQRFNSCYNNITHTGFDFGFDWPAPPASPLFRTFVAPCDGIVTEVKKDMVLMGFEVGIRCSEGLDTFLAFEQCSLDVAILEMQKTELDLAAYVNQVVRQGQRIGRLVVSQAMDGCLGPHVHWGVRQTSSGTEGIAVCPRDYSDAASQSRVDDLFKRLCDGNSSWLYPPCLPPPPPECHVP